jgi:GT2 family glycosyltransferase
LLRFGVFDEQFFMYGDDLDLCYRCQRAGYKVIYDGRVKLIHLKGMSSSKESDKMARAVFTSTKQFYLKHFNPHNSLWVKWKYGLLFGLWERFALFKAKIKGHKRARPL